MTLDVIQRNFLRLLRCATFGNIETIEPMTPWKWQRLYNMSLLHGVTGLVYDGIQRCSGDFFLQIPQSQMDMWHRTTTEIENANKAVDIQASAIFSEMNHNKLRAILIKGQGLATLYPNPLHRKSGDIDIFFPYQSHYEKANLWAREKGEEIDDSENSKLGYTISNIRVENHERLASLTNVIANNRLQSIIEAEIKCCDSSYAIINGYRIEVPPPTLNLLIILVRITRYILNDGISLKQLVDLGMFMRKEGDKVDFVKLQGWIEKLKMKTIVQLIAAVEIELFGFEAEELPFLSEKINVDISTIVKDIFRMKGNHSEDWYFTQGKNIFVRTSNSTAMMWHIRRTGRYFRYYPSETATNAVYSFVHSLSHIEE